MTIDEIRDLHARVVKADLGPAVWSTENVGVLLREIDRLRAALQPFADLAAGRYPTTITVYAQYLDCRRAAEVLGVTGGRRVE